MSPEMLNKLIAKDPEVLYEAYGILEAALPLKKSISEYKRSLIILLSTYIERPIEEINPDKKDYIAQLCFQLTELFDVIERTKIEL